MNAIQLLPILGLPLALLAGFYGLAKGVIFLRALVRGRGQSYSPPCTPSRQPPITGTPARKVIIAHRRGPDWDQVLEDAWKRLEVREHEPLGK